MRGAPSRIFLYATRAPDPLECGREGLYSLFYRDVYRHLFRDTVALTPAIKLRRGVYISARSQIVAAIVPLMTRENTRGPARPSPLVDTVVPGGEAPFTGT